MLKLNPNPTFAWPVTFKSPEGEHTLKAIFRWMSRDEFDKYREAADKVASDYNAALEAHQKAVETAKEKGEPIPEAPKPSKSQADEVLDILVGWEDVDVPFSKENFEQLLANYWDLTINKLWEAFGDGLTQRKREN